MKKLTSLLPILWVCFGLSCKKKFLEVIDTTRLVKQGYVVDLQTTAQYMNGVYVLLVSNEIGYASGNNIVYPEYIADNVKKRSGIDDIYLWNQSADKPTIYNGAGQWLGYYRIIRSCNFVIDKTEEYKKENKAKSENIKGQALAIRAWMHFLLVNMFGQSYNYTSDASHLGIPYVRTSDIEEPISRQPVATIYQNVINDLNDALQLLPVVDKGKKDVFNYETAKALLARIYLFKEDFLKAKDLSQEVLKDVPMMISGYPGKLYTNQETEALFQVYPAKATDNYIAGFLGYYTADVFSLLATKNISQLYRQYSSDKRNAWVRDSITPSNNFFGTLITKFPKAVAGLSSVPSMDYYQTLFRSTEMVLTIAECYARLNMDDSARHFINQIRSRASIPVFTPAVTGKALMDSIRMERNKEMAFDGIRMYDLLRWKLGVNRLDPLTPDAQILPYPSNKAIAPIPLTDVQLSGLEQNPGYQ